MIDLRLDCLRLAHSPAESADEVVRRAQAYHDFLMSRDDRKARDSEAGREPILPGGGSLR